MSNIYINKNKRKEDKKLKKKQKNSKEAYRKYQPEIGHF